MLNPAHSDLFDGGSGQQLLPLSHLFENLQICSFFRMELTEAFHFVAAGVHCPIRAVSQ